MQQKNNSLLVCPLDGACLQREQSSWRCEHGHSFDMAKQGYLNLLSVQDKRSKDPGDTKVMIAARARILDAGLYTPIAQQLNAIVLKSIPSQLSDSVIVDAGCGNGYYLDSLIKHTSAQGIGVDISKWAIMAAAKCNKHITWLVASNRKLPISDHSVDIVICAFGFPDFAAFKKVLKPKGIIVMIDPAEKHLIEMRQVIYPFIKSYHANDFLSATLQGYSVVEQQSLNYLLKEVKQTALQDILTMSPHLYKTNTEGKEKMAALAHLSLTVDVQFSVLTLR